MCGLWGSWGLSVVEGSMSRGLLNVVRAACWAQLQQALNGLLLWVEGLGFRV